MRKMWVLWLILVVFVGGCAPSANPIPTENLENDPAPTQSESTVETDDVATATIAPAATDVRATFAPSACYPDGEHPIAANIATQYSTTTDYVEVMDWFCAGAEFDDILNALTTEELSGVDAYDLLQRIATGQTWDELWVELGIVEE